MDREQDPHFRKSLKNAEKIMGDHNRVKALLDQFDQLLNKKNQSIHNVGDDLKSLKRLISAFHKGSYSTIPWKSLILAVATVIYFVNPLDLIPDFLVGPGFIDDIGILMICLRRIHRDLEEFKKWEKENPLAQEKDP
jgi:uncharacterized membrane protein YkvA (DUF1232 family)